MQKEKWIITIHDSSENATEAVFFEGTEAETRLALMSLLNKDKANEDTDSYEYGTESEHDVEKYFDDDTSFYLYAFALYYDWHIDYTARRVSDIQTLREVC